MKQAIITVLGTIGKNNKGEYPTAKYRFHKDIISEENNTDAINTFPLLLQLFGDKFNIIPVYTEEALKIQKDVLSHEKIEFDIEANGEKIADNNYDEIFDTINTLLSNDEYGHVIIDLSHGYRHLPLLAIVSMVIKNFQDSDKIRNILYAKEIEKYKQYEIVDLKEYLELANIAFILTAFNLNYTVGQHINSKKYNTLLYHLNQLSDDIMASNLNNLFSTTAKGAIEALKKVSGNKAISKEAKILKENLEKVFSHENKYYLTYYKLSKDFFEKNYMLLSLAMLYESIRLYIKTTIKKDERGITESIERYYRDDLYKIGDFFRKLAWRPYSKLDEKRDPRISEADYTKLKNAFPHYINELLENIDKKRNNLAHANTRGSFDEIKEDIKELLDEYEALCIKEKSSRDLIAHFSR